MTEGRRQLSPTTPAQLARAVLGTLADVAPTAEERSGGRTIPLDWFQWLSLDAAQLFPGHLGIVGGLAVDPSAPVRIDRAFAERLAAIDQIRPGQHSLRVGWLFVAGRQPDGARVFHPLVTVPVVVTRVGLSYLHSAGDVELTELIEDEAVRRDLETRIELGGGGLTGAAATVGASTLARMTRLHEFASAAAYAADLPAVKLVPADQSPDVLMRNDGLVIVAGFGVYATHEVGGVTRAGSLRTWATSPLETWTALHSLYIPTEGPPAEPDASPVRSPYRLTPHQRDALRSARTAPVTVISGAPGTGKSHTIAALALDAVSRGQSVLVAAKAEATVDALMDLFEHAPGCSPVVFGSSERRAALAARLSGGALSQVPAERVGAARKALERASHEHDALTRAMAVRIEAEASVASMASFELSRVMAPRLFDPSTDLEAVEGALRQLGRPATTWWGRRRRRRWLVTLARLTGADETIEPDQVIDALHGARVQRERLALEAGGGLTLADLTDALEHAEQRVRIASAAWIAADLASIRRLDRKSLGAVAALATALRSGRAARREQLRRIDHASLVRALPLWVGTLGDVEDLLPATPACFDLLVLDEASSIDQPLAAPALLRAKRVVVVGDPRQLRHVSFLSDERVGTAIAHNDLGGRPSLAAALDVRRNSVFDVGAGAAPVHRLDEHFRSDPHLVEFVARRIYGGDLRVATRTPLSELRDCIDLIEVAGTRDEHGVVIAEVQRVVSEIRRLAGMDARSVGVITPFRAQADALEAAVLAAFTADELEALDLRVGTVHAFQGNERDHIVASLGVPEGASPATWRFVEDPHLFSVFVTRARRRMSLVLSAHPPRGGLVDDFLAQADAPPGRPRPADEPSRWASRVADQFADAGYEVLRCYPIGRHVVDVCVVDRAAYYAVDCDIHDDGADAHIDRLMALRAGGWSVLEGYRSRWNDRIGEMVPDLLGPPGSGARVTGRDQPC